MITHIDINLLDWFDATEKTTAIAQSCNTFFTMGSGIALQIKKRYPSAYDADLNYGERGDRTKLGRFSHAIISSEPKKIIYNIYGQHEFGYGQRQTNYEAIYSGLEKFKLHATLEGIEYIGLPKNMGSKLGGADWRIVEKMIEVIFENSGFEVFICNYDPSSI